MRLLRDRHLWTLIAILAVAAGIRGYRLDFRPLSTDETLTTLVGIGRTHQDVPIGQAFSLDRLDQLFAPVQGLSFGQIRQHLGDPEMHHAHPPAFYWSAYALVDAVNPTTTTSLIVTMRMLPALFGVLAVALTFRLAADLFDAAVGRFAAVLMALSPLAVQMSQDARNYTLPLVFLLIALICLCRLWPQRATHDASSSVWWSGWAAANALAIYSHYFCVLAFVAQIAALAITAPRVNRRNRSLGLAIVAVIAATLPLAVTLIADYSRLTATRSDNEWLQPQSALQPLGQLVLSWASMFAAVPNEAMGRWQASLSTLTIIVAAFVVLPAIGVTLRRLWEERSSAMAMLMLFGAIALAELGFVVYGLQRNVFQFARYQFIYFPVMLIATAGGVMALRRAMLRRTAVVALIVSAAVGSGFNAAGFGFQDAYHSRRIATDVARSGRSTLTVMGGDSFLTTAMGLSVAREIHAQARVPAFFAYVPWHEQGDEWPGRLRVDSVPDDVWLVHPPSSSRFPAKVRLGQFDLMCEQSGQAARSGLEYQRYRCGAGALTR